MDNKSMIQIIDRNTLTISGVNKIISFTPTYFDIDTLLGGVIVRGQNLEMASLNLDNKELIIKGMIDSLSYGDSKKKEKEESILKKLFK